MNARDSLQMQTARDRSSILNSNTYTTAQNIENYNRFAVDDDDDYADWPGSQQQQKQQMNEDHYIPVDDLN